MMDDRYSRLPTWYRAKWYLIDFLPCASISLLLSLWGLLVIHRNPMGSMVCLLYILVVCGAYMTGDHTTIKQKILARYLSKLRRRAAGLRASIDVPNDIS